MRTMMRIERHPLDVLRAHRPNRNVQLASVVRPTAAHPSGRPSGHPPTVPARLTVNVPPPNAYTIAAYGALLKGRLIDRYV